MSTRDATIDFRQPALTALIGSPMLMNSLGAMKASMPFNPSLPQTLPAQPQERKIHGSIVPYHAKKIDVDSDEHHIVGDPDELCFSKKHIEVIGSAIFPLLRFAHPRKWQQKDHDESAVIKAGDPSAHLVEVNTLATPRLVLRTRPPTTTRRVPLFPGPMFHRPYNRRGYARLVKGINNADKRPQEMEQKPGSKRHQIDPGNFRDKLCQ